MEQGQGSQVVDGFTAAGKCGFSSEVHEKSSDGYDSDTRCEAEPTAAAALLSNGLCSGGAGGLCGGPSATTVTDATAAAGPGGSECSSLDGEGINGASEQLQRQHRDPDQGPDSSVTRRAGSAASPSGSAGSSSSSITISSSNSNSSSSSSSSDDERAIAVSGTPPPPNNTILELECTCENNGEDGEKQIERYASTFIETRGVDAGTGSVVKHRQFEENATKTSLQRTDSGGETHALSELKYQENERVTTDERGKTVSEKVVQTSESHESTTSTLEVVGDQLFRKAHTTRRSSCSNSNVNTNMDQDAEAAAAAKNEKFAVSFNSDTSDSEEDSSSSEEEEEEEDVIKMKHPSPVKDSEKVTASVVNGTAENGISDGSEAGSINNITTFSTGDLSISASIDFSSVEYANDTAENSALSSTINIDSGAVEQSISVVKDQLQSTKARVFKQKKSESLSSESSEDTESSSSASTLSDVVDFAKVNSETVGGVKGTDGGDGVIGSHVAVGGGEEGKETGFSINSNRGGEIEESRRQECIASREAGGAPGERAGESADGPATVGLGGMGLGLVASDQELLKIKVTADDSGGEPTALRSVVDGGEGSMPGGGLDGTKINLLPSADENHEQSTDTTTTIAAAADVRTSYSVGKESASRAGQLVDLNAEFSSSLEARQQGKAADVYTQEVIDEKYSKVLSRIFESGELSGRDVDRQRKERHFIMGDKSTTASGSAATAENGLATADRAADTAAARGATVQNGEVLGEHLGQVKVVTSSSSSSSAATAAASAAAAAAAASTGKTQSLAHQSSSMEEKTSASHLESKIYSKTFDGSDAEERSIIQSRGDFDRADEDADYNAKSSTTGEFSQTDTKMHGRSGDRRFDDEEQFVDTDERLYSRARGEMEEEGEMEFDGFIRVTRPDGGESAVCHGHHADDDDGVDDYDMPPERPPRNSRGEEWTSTDDLIARILAEARGEKVPERKPPRKKPAAPAAYRVDADAAADGHHDGGDRYLDVNYQGPDDREPSLLERRLASYDKNSKSPEDFSGRLGGPQEGEDGGAPWRSSAVEEGGRYASKYGGVHASGDATAQRYSSTAYKQQQHQDHGQEDSAAYMSARSRYSQGWKQKQRAICDDEEEYAYQVPSRAPPPQSRYNQYGAYAAPDSDGDDEHVAAPRKREHFLPDDAFAPRRSDDTDDVVKERTSEIRTVVDRQTNVLKSLKSASASFDELDTEIRNIRQQFIENQAARETIMDDLFAEAEAGPNEAEETLGARYRPPPTLKRAGYSLDSGYNYTPSYQPSNRNGGKVVDDDEEEDSHGGGRSAVDRKQRSYGTSGKYSLDDSYSSSVSSSSKYKSYSTGHDEANNGDMGDDADKESVRSYCSSTGGDAGGEVDPEASRSSGYKSRYAGTDYGGSYSSTSSSRGTTSSTSRYEGLRDSSASSSSDARAARGLRRAQTIGQTDMSYERPRRYSSVDSASSSGTGSRFLDKVREKKACGEELSTRDKPFKSRFLRKSFDSSSSTATSSSMSYDRSYGSSYTPRSAGADKKDTKSSDDTSSSAGASDAAATADDSGANA